MSTWLFGEVEYRDKAFGSEWFAVINAGCLIVGDYDLYGCLFGVRNYANFEPLFANRGLPEDCCESVKQSFCDDFHSPTFCSFSELRSINLEEYSTKPDERQWYTLQSKNGPIRIKGNAPPGVDAEPARRMQRAEALSNEGYQTVYKLMAVLADRFGEENVRLVVYFD